MAATLVTENPVDAAMSLSDLAKEQAAAARAIAEQIEAADCEQRHGRSVPD